jgi:hypothetical protein
MYLIQHCAERNRDRLGQGKGEALRGLKTRRPLPVEKGGQTVLSAARVLPTLNVLRVGTEWSVPIFDKLLEIVRRIGAPVETDAAAPAAERPPAEDSGQNGYETFTLGTPYVRRSTLGTRNTLGVRRFFFSPHRHLTKQKLNTALEFFPNPVYK